MFPGERGGYAPVEHPRRRPADAPLAFFRDFHVENERQQQLVEEFQAIAVNLRQQLDRLDTIVLQLTSAPANAPEPEPEMVLPLVRPLARPTQLKTVVEPLEIAEAPEPHVAELDLAEPVRNLSRKTHLAISLGLEESEEDIGLGAPAYSSAPQTQLALDRQPLSLLAEASDPPAAVQETHREGGEEPPPVVESQAEPLFRKGCVLLRGGDAMQAIAFFSEALARDASFTPAYLERGQAHRQRGQFTRAIADFTMAVTLQPDRADGYVRRGNVLTDQGRLDQAIADYTEAIRLDPEQPLIYMNRALVRARKNQYGQVIEDAGTALRLNARLSAARFARGVAFAHLGRLTDAINDFNQILREEPQNALAYNERGLIHARSGDYDAAIADYDRAIHLDRKLLLPRYNRGLAYRLKGDHEHAAADFTEVLRRRPKNGAAHYQRGLALLSLGRLDAALADFDAALALNPMSEEAHIGRRRVLKAQAKRTRRPTREMMVPGVGPGRVANSEDSQALKVECPSCGASGQVRWDRLGKLLECAGCSRHYRMLNNGELEAVEIQRGIWVTVRSFLPGATRHWVPLPKDESEQQRQQRRRRRWAIGVAAAAVLLVATGVSSFFALQSAETVEEPLPQELNARAERFAHAYMAKEDVILRRLTSSAHDRVLRSWLRSNPPPATPAEPEDLHVQVKVGRQSASRAELMVQLSGLPGERTHITLRQMWERRNETWYFVPPLEHRMPPPAKTATAITNKAKAKAKADADKAKANADKAKADADKARTPAKTDPEPGPDDTPEPKKPSEEIGPRNSKEPTP